MTEIDPSQKMELLRMGYAIGKAEHYNPGGSLEYDAVIYPDGRYEIYRDFGEANRLNLPVALTIEEQWALAWEDYQQNKEARGD